ncbi:hypothetical protein SDC9_69481 [bioreactor metagenome]|uniref:Uncharacterized protein n=1 Tax=bioreactor metagenome TaxID=1076179 RepID=A0A644Y3T7_9ZZZZ
MLPNNLLYKLVQEALGKEVIENYEESFTNRLLVQKLVYMFQELNQIKRYEYSWYLAGPYSKKLTSQIYNMVLFLDENDKRQWSQLRFSSKGQDYIKKVTDFFKVDEAELKEYNLTKSDWFELMASLYYLKQRDKIKDKDILVNSLLKAKDKFRLEQIKFAVDKYGNRLGFAA